MRLRMSKRYHIAVVGATGAVGVEMFRVLERRGFPVASIRAFSSKRSAGKSALFHGEKIPVTELAPDSFRGIDLALFSAGTAVAREFAPIARDAGAIVIDNSSIFRMEPEVPLVIPEINGDDAKLHRGIIANPNCTTAVALMAIYPLHRIFNVQRVFAASYQAVSGSGARAIAELEEQVRAAAESRPARTEVYPHPIAFNVLPQVDAFLESGYTKEEMKMQNEGRRIMHHPLLLACAFPFTAHIQWRSARNFPSRFRWNGRGRFWRKHPVWSWLMNRRVIGIRCRCRLPGKTIVRSVGCGAIARLKMDSLSGFRAISC